MLSSAIIITALIPSLIIVGAATSSNNDNVQTGRAFLNSRQLPVPGSSEEDDIFGNDDFFNKKVSLFPSSEESENRPRGPIIRDPVLRDIYEEAKRLNLDGGDDDMDMRSEEARELINFQRRKMHMMQNFARQAGAVVGIPPQTEPQGRALSFGPRNIPTEYPILLPSPTSAVPEATSTRPSRGLLGIGGVFGKVKTGFGSAINTIFGGSGTTTTTAPPPPSSNNNINFSGEENPSFRPPQNIGSESNSIVFGGDTPSEPLNCNGTQTEYNGNCYNVLQELPCAKGEWLIEDDATGKGKCVENKCSNEHGTAFFAGKCVIVRAGGDHCHQGMITYIFKNGEVECDCKDEYLYNQRDGNCYPAYRRGPCNAGEIFVTRLTSRGALPASCIRSKCSKDGYFCNAPSCPNDRNCIALKSKCPTGQWDIHPVKLSPACIDFNVHDPGKIIGNVPTLACAPGSRRDILGTCRKPSRISFS